MMTALATVTDVHSQGNGYHIALSCEQKTSCSSCASQKSCGTGIVSKAVGKKSLLWQLDTQQKVTPGQVVEIGFPEKSLLQSAALVYVLPLVMMMFGAWLGDAWLAPALQTGEGVTILSAALFIGLGIALAKRWSVKLEQRSAREVVLVRVLGEPVIHPV